MPAQNHAVPATHEKSGKSKPLCMSGATLHTAVSSSLGCRFGSWQLTLCGGRWLGLCCTLCCSLGCSREASGCWSTGLATQAHFGDVTNARLPHVVKQALDLRAAMDEHFLPESISGVLNQLDECDQQAHGCGRFTIRRSNRILVICSWMISWCCLASANKWRTTQEM